MLLDDIASVNQQTRESAFDLVVDMLEEYSNINKDDYIHLQELGSSLIEELGVEPTLNNQDQFVLDSCI